MADSSRTNMGRRVYLDNAATSWPKPESVYTAMDQFARQIGAPYGRGAHRSALQSHTIVDQARTALRQLLGARHDDLVVFGLNGTDALNLCLHGFIKPHDHVVTTVIEHNSVLRPLHWLAQHASIQVDLVPCGPSLVIDPDDVRRALKPSTRLVVVSHASNVTGAVQPIKQIIDVAHSAGVRVLVDAAQTAGCYPLDFRDLQIDMLACSGHKGLLGPLGTGVAVLSAELADSVRSLRQGGTGTLSSSPYEPQQGVEKYEVGNLNVLGLAGLAAGIEYVQAHAPELRNRKAQLRQRLCEALIAIPGIHLYGAPLSANSVDVVSFNLAGVDPHDLAIMAESEVHIELRAGLHCAPRMHDTLGTLPLNGTVRASLGPFNTEEHVDRLLDFVSRMATAVSTS